MNIIEKITSAPRTKIVLILAGAVALIYIGFFSAITFTRAASISIPIEAESGTLSGGATIGSNSNASGGRYIQFGAPVVVTPPPVTPPPTTTTTTADLDNPVKKEIAMMIVSTAENSSLDWRAQYSYIEDIGDGRGYTGGIVGFCSGTSDMLAMVQYYNTIAPNNVLTPYIPALKNVDGTASHTGLGDAFVAAWEKAALDPKFKEAQNYERDRVYFNPAVSQAKTDGLKTLGQFVYYDALVMHGPGDDSVSFGGIRATAMRNVKTPAQGGDEKAYIKAFLAARKAAMLTEAAHEDTSRVDTEQTLFLNNGNLYLNLPLSWSTYGDPFSLTEANVTNYINTGRL